MQSHAHPYVVGRAQAAAIVLDGDHCMSLFHERRRYLQLNPNMPRAGVFLYIRQRFHHDLLHMEDMFRRHEQFRCDLGQAPHHANASRVKARLQPVA